MRPCVSLKFLMRPMDSNWSLRVFIGPHSSLLILMGPNGSFYIFVRSYVSLWVVLSPYAFLIFFFGFYRS